VTTSAAVVARTLRAPFLVLSPACVAPGIATAYVTAQHFSSLQASLVLIGALLAHISVNTLNEYFDFHSGLDAATKRTPFSGGSGSLPAHPRAAPLVLLTALITLLLTVAVGLYFVMRQGAALLPLGLVGLFLVVTYTNVLTRSPWACLAAPGVGFGPLMVIGTHVALTGRYQLMPVLASLPAFFLASNLLLLNQFPDVEADRRVGRRHLPIAWGRRASARMYTVLALAAYVSLVLAVALGGLPKGALLGLSPLPLAIAAAARVILHAEHIDALLPAMRLNVMVALLTPILIALGIAIS